MTIKLLLHYDKVNEKGTFSPGDTVLGMATVVASKETKVQCFVVNVKGKAKVKWSEQDGAPAMVHTDKKIYFHFEQIILQERRGDGSEMISSGKHVYPFAFQIPNNDMPSSYTGKWGEITYSLRAKLTRTIWMVYKAKTELPFVSQKELIIAGLKEPQFGTRISFFGSRNITMHITSETMGLTQGEAMTVSAEVLNNSANAVSPRFYLCQKQSFFAQSKTTVQADDIMFGLGDVVPAFTSQTVTRVLTIPHQLPVSFFNCSLMTLEYMLKVSLDVPRFWHPEIKLPLDGTAEPGEEEAQHPRAHHALERMVE
ncbi:arrestin domain-containing protein 3-like [Aplochiton taeniatus]